MAAIVGTIFRKNGNVYYLDSSDILLAVGDKAICRLEEVIEIGEIVSVSSRISEDIVPSTTKKIIRKATYCDMSVDELNKAKEAEGYIFALNHEQKFADGWKWFANAGYNYNKLN